jgi:predicted tellurium resistance membrane protein TerC
MIFAAILLFIIVRYKSQMSIIAKILIGIGYSLMMSGSFFHIAHWPSANEQLVSAFALLISGLLVVIMKNRNPKI